MGKTSPEKLAQIKAWQKANPEKMAAYKERSRPKKNAYMREYWKRKRDHYRGQKLLRAYGIDLERYQEMVEAQGGKCAICGDLPRSGKGKRLYVDHDHVTGVVRALLCHHCNAAIGHMGESIERLEMAIVYLRRHR